MKNAIVVNKSNNNKDFADYRGFLVAETLSYLQTVYAIARDLSGSVPVPENVRNAVGAARDADPQKPALYRELINVIAAETKKL